MESDGLPVNSEYHILPYGLVNSKRVSLEGITYAGYKEKNGDGTYLNDIVLPEEAGVGDQHFMIKYNKVLAAYQLQDLHDGTGTFVRLELPYTLKRDDVISFGDSHMLVSLGNFCEPSITLSFIDGPKTGTSW